VIVIHETDAPDVVLHEATFGDGSRDYRISDVDEHYITNFKTQRQPTEYTVRIMRGDFEIGSFSFVTVRRRG